MNTLAYFEIQATDPQKVMDFYHHVFGWNFVLMAELSLAYWRIQSEGIMGGLYKRPAELPPAVCGANAFVCSMQVDDFDVTTKKIEAAGGKITMPKFAIPGLCWQGYFLDVDGNIFGIFQPDAEAK